MSVMWEVMASGGGRGGGGGGRLGGVSGSKVSRVGASISRIGASSKSDDVVTASGVTANKIMSLVAQK